MDDGDSAVNTFSLSELKNATGDMNSSGDQSSTNFDDEDLLPEGTDFKTLMLHIIKQNDALDAKLDSLTSKVADMEAKQNDNRMHQEISHNSSGDSQQLEDSEDVIAVYCDEMQREIPVSLPADVKYSVMSASSRSAIVTHLLKHFHPIAFLRSCTLSGNSTSNKRDAHGDFVNKTLPCSTTKAIVATVQNIMPLSQLKLALSLKGTDTFNDKFFNEAVEQDTKDVKCKIAKSLQYFLQSYSSDGKHLRSHRQKKSSGEDSSQKCTSGKHSTASSSTTYEPTDMS